PGSAVPSFVVLGPDGSILDRWVGALDAEKLSLRLLRGKHLAKLPEEYRERWDRAARRLADNDVEPLREMIAVLAHAGQEAWAKRLSLMECREHFYRYRWSMAVEAAGLTLRRWPGTVEAEQLRARALYRGTGTIEAATRKRVAALIDTFDESKPIFGGEPAVAAWQKRVRAARDEVIAIGEPAVDQLMVGLLEANEEISETCANCIGRIRDSRVLPDLILHLQNRKLRHPVRARVAGAMDVWCDPAFLPALIERLSDRRDAMDVRIASADAIRRLGVSHGGLTGAPVVEPIFRALSDRNKQLRLECLQLLYTVNDNFDLARLFEFMDDHRSDSLFTISDLACDLFLVRVGHDVQLADGTRLDEGRYPAGTGAFLRDWWNLNAGTLIWDEKLHRYYVARKD
ncbi:MAG: HEAT repeat domain-containing protein, partial [Planctomycetota bacterium]